MPRHNRGMDKQLRTLAADLATDLGHGRAASDIVADAIRHLIAAGNLKPGDRLPAERELAPMLGAARVTVRAAIQALNAEGLLVTGRGRSAGTKVAARTAPATSVASFKQAIADNYEFRKAIEPMAAELAAERGSAVERKALLRLCEPGNDSEVNFQGRDRRFHLLIARMSGNRHILEAVERNRSQFEILVNSLLLRIDSRAAPTFGEEHGRIAAAIVRGDGPAARREMAAHFKRAHRQFQDALSGAKAPRAAR